MPPLLPLCRRGFRSARSLTLGATVFAAGLFATPTAHAVNFDNFADAFAIPGSAATVIATNAGATKEAGEPNHASNTGGASVWFSWTAPFSAPVSVETRGSSFDTLLAVYTGDTVNALTPVASNDDYDFANGIRQSALRFTAIAGTSYHIAVDGYGGVSGTIFLRLNALVLQVSTLAGTAGAPGTDDGIGAAARFMGPAGMAFDPTTGNLIVADSFANNVRRITPAGVVTTLAGASGPPGAADGPADLATFSSPQDVAVDLSGNVYVADSANHKIRKITPAGDVTTLAGTGVAGAQDHDDGSQAMFANPVALAVDSAFNVYVADSGNHKIRKITPGGQVSTFAGSGTQGAADNPVGTSATFNNPLGIAVDAQGNVYVSDSGNHVIRKITPTGAVTTLAGLAGFPGSDDGVGTNARFDSPRGLAVDAQGTVYVANTVGHTIRRITPSGVVTTIAGQAGASGAADGTGADARFNFPGGVAVDAAGNIYIADSDSATIRKGVPLTTSLFIRTEPLDSEVVAGADTHFDVVAAAVGFEWYQVSPDGGPRVKLIDNATYSGTTTPRLTITSASAGLHGSRYEVEVTSVLETTRTSRAARLTIAPNYVISTLAGTAGVSGATDGTGAAARFQTPTSVVADDLGNVFVADLDNHQIRKITPAGEVTTLAGNASTAGNVDGEGNAALFHSPYGIEIDAAGNLYVSDWGNHNVRKITPAGVVTTLAGPTGPSPVSGLVDGTGAAARFRFPSGMVFHEGTGDLYVADAVNHVIRKITSAGEVTTYAGSTSGSSGSVDGSLLAARFGGPSGVTRDGAGNLYVADKNNNAIRKISAGDSVSTFAGSAAHQGDVDAVGGAARFFLPDSMAIDTSGNLYVTEKFVHQIRKITPAGVVTTIAGTGASGSADGPGTSASFSIPSGIATDAAGNLFIADSSNHTIRKAVPLITPLTIARQPEGTALLAGRSATFTVVAPGTSFQWQRSPDNGATWTDVSNDSVYSGATTPQLTISAATTAMSGERFRVVIGNGGFASEVTSEGALFTVVPTYTVSTLAGSGSAGSANGTGTAAQFDLPRGIVANPAGNVFVADENAAIRKITPEGAVSTFLGSSAPFINAYYLALDAAGNLFASDTFADVVHKITATGASSVIVVPANVIAPLGVTVLADGTLFLADGSTHTIHRITPAGDFSTFAGSGTPGSADGNGTAASFFNPGAVVSDSVGNLFLTDVSNHTIRRITPAGNVTTFAGAAGSSGLVDGPGTTARFSFPRGLAIDQVGNLFVADAERDAIRQVTPAGVVVTIAGGQGPGNTDGPGDIALFKDPWGIAVDTAGNLYITDTSNHTIRKATPDYGKPGIRSARNAMGTALGAFTYTIEANGLPTSYGATGLPPGLTINQNTGVISGTPTAAGLFDVTITATNNAGTSDAVITFSIAAPEGPAINPGPAAASAAAGATATFTASVILGADTYSNLTFQWQTQSAGGGAWTDLANNATYSGVATLTLQVKAATALNGHRYRLVVTDSFDTAAESAGATLTVTPGSRLLNLSTRAASLTGENVLIPGFVLGGSGTKKLLIRGVGPTLATFGVGGVLADPLLTLKRTIGTTTTDVATNDNWGTNANVADLLATTTTVGAFDLTGGSADAALLVDLEPGQYSVVTEGVGGGTGIAIVELYDADVAPATSSLINISTRGFVGTGEQVMIPGFVISSEGPKTLLIRAVGPTLSDFGVSGTLADPRLVVNRTEIDGSNTPLLTQDNWGDNSDASNTATVADQVGAFALTAGSKDAAFVITLPPGVYTVVGSSAVGASTGVLLVEIYVVP